MKRIFSNISNKWIFIYCLSTVHIWCNSVDFYTPGNKFNHLLFIFTSFLILPANCIPSRQRVAMQQLLNTNQHIRQEGE